MNLGFVISECLRDFFASRPIGKRPPPFKTGKDELHLRKTIEWIGRSAENGRGGCASHYHLLKGGWTFPFPETTGYIIPTLFDYAQFSGEKKYAALALKLTDWLRDVQLDNGACMEGLFDETKGKNPPCIFNTGQNMLGFIRAYSESGNPDYFDSAKRAADFLVSSTDENGIWNKHLLRGLKHTINSRCSWALLMFDRIHPSDSYKKVALANLDWTVDQQTSNGWFRHGTSRINGFPNTHFLSYTCEGLLESYRINKEKKYFDTALITAEKMRNIFEDRNMLFAFWDENWNNRGRYFRNSKGKFICLTGNIQISSVWMMLYEETGERKFFDAAIRMLDFIKTIHNITSLNKGINGGIKGSFPVYGSYSMLSYPNWAAKFFCDAMMQKIRLSSRN